VGGAVFHSFTEWDGSFGCVSAVQSGWMFVYVMYLVYDALTQPVLGFDPAGPMDAPIPVVPYSF
jgi:hypothetical protein